MYKVLLVDDEQMIREGIAAVVNWESQGFSLIGTARNGIEAFAMVIQDPPQILITDIKMPGLNGLDLIAKVKNEFPDMQFVVLSGYGEFELAKQAMHYGVKHYLLKPCNEKKILETLEEIKKELQDEEAKEAGNKKNREILNIILPRVKEEFLRDYIIGRNEFKNEYQELFQEFDIENQRLRLVLFQFQGETVSEMMLKFKQVIDSEMGVHKYFSILENNQIIALADPMVEGELVSQIHHIKKVALLVFTKEILVAYSKIDHFKNAPLLYGEVEEYLHDSLERSFHSALTYSKLIHLVIKQIHENIANEELSLKWLASKVLFMNEGYMSKLFLKETGEKFSHYLTRIRMEKAKELLIDDNRVCEVARQVGYGNNPQYFSQLFKKYTGFTPSEFYKEK